MNRIDIYLLDESLDQAIKDAEEEFARSGITHDARESFEKLKEKYFGQLPKNYNKN
ncbi:hypothetical protein [Anaerorhabdus furcosa]|uniref:hypothetical protein n=1 Tax=Anaerorhabdus furcosa TaxID=118967 RepID=UPI0013564A00|nr:hypothetical protein [Anaerorhabdus furcosa]